MRRGLRGLVIVLGMLWVAAVAEAFTMWNGETSRESRSFLFEDYGGVWGGSPGGSGFSSRRQPARYPSVGLSPSIRRREPVPYSYLGLAPRSSVRAGGNSRFGRRDFIWHPGSFGPPNDYVAVRPPPPLRGFRPRYSPINRWDGTIIMLPGLDRLRNDYAGEAIQLLPGLEQESPFGARVEFRWDRFFYSQQDFGGASASVVGNAAPVPEPGTGALLLAGLCALAARRRRC